MKYLFTSLLAISALVISPCLAQNVGIGTSSPNAKLDISGDLALRSQTVTVADGITYALDVNTVKSSNYRLTGPTANFVIAGITAGNDGRIITLYNRSGQSLQLYNEDLTATAADRIQTGINTKLDIYPGGTVTLQYDISATRWTVLSQHNSSLDFWGGSTATYWTPSGNDIYNSNSGNIGIGVVFPSHKLDIGGSVRIAGPVLTGGSGLYATSGGSFTIYDEAGFDIMQFDGSHIQTVKRFSSLPGSSFNDMMLNQYGGNVGIRTSAAPQASLRVGRGTGAQGTVVLEGTTHWSHFNFSSGEETYIRGGKTGSAVYINDSHNGNVNLASSNGDVNFNNSNGNINIYGNNMYATQTGTLNLVPLGIINYRVIFSNGLVSFSSVYNVAGSVLNNWNATVETSGPDDYVIIRLFFNPAAVSGYSSVHSVGEAGFQNSYDLNNPGNYITASRKTDYSNRIELYFEMDAISPLFSAEGKLLIYGVK